MRATATAMMAMESAIFFSNGSFASGISGDSAMGRVACGSELAWARSEDKAYPMSRLGTGLVFGAFAALRHRRGRQRMKVQPARGEHLDLGAARDAMRRFSAPEEEPVFRAAAASPF